MAWKQLVVGACVLVECPSRWYLGRVASRDGVTVNLAEAICGHDLGDLGLFLEGTISDTTELTPLPRGIELNLGSIDSVQEYPVELLARVRKRTHLPSGEANHG